MHKNLNLYLLLSVLVIGGLVTWGFPFQQENIERGERGIPILYGYTVCGDGTVWAGHEACDDGDTSSGDGCSATCTVESGWTCAGTVPSVCQKCGNGLIEGTEACDDSDTDNGDGCSATCTVETGYSCIGEPSSCSTVCGDGLITGSEACDDSDTDSGDGCSSTCTIENGFGCSGTPSSCSSTCPDGVVASDEGCDDNNATNEDGCSDACVVENGFSCNGEPSSCASTCQDGVVASDEGCDDDNAVNEDGCSSVCAVETYYTCSGEPSVCGPLCGDGTVFLTEECDDNNVSGSDGCSSVCVTESGWTCSGTPSSCSTTCGDNIVAGDEECELPGADSCSSICRYNTGGGVGTKIGTTSGRKESRESYISYGWIFDIDRPLSSDIPVRGRVLTSCGNGEINIGEECDDGNIVDFDGCSIFCYLELGFCGDGLLQRSLGEECESKKILKDGLWIYPEIPVCTEDGEYYCTAPEHIGGGCRIVTRPVCGAPQDVIQVEEQPYCGDGRKDFGEECDLGGICIGGEYHGTLWADRNEALICNANNGTSSPRSGDGCDDKCRREFCGDGQMQSVEGCDNGRVCSNDPSRLCRSDADCSGGLCEYNSTINSACTDSCGLCYGMYRAILDLNNIDVGRHTIKVKVSNPCGAWAVKETDFTIEEEAILTAQKIPVHDIDVPLRSTMAQVRRGITSLHLSLITNKNRFISGIDKNIGLDLIVVDDNGNLVHSLRQQEFMITLDDEIVQNVSFMETTSENCSVQIQQLRNVGQAYDCQAPLNTAICGDGYVEEDEECDDGNLNSNDGCSDLCNNELFRFAAPVKRGEETGGIYIVPQLRSAALPTSCKVSVQFEIGETSMRSTGQNLLTQTDGEYLEFKDIPFDAWFALFVDAVSRKGIVSGYRDNFGRPLGIFKPSESVTFAEMAKMVSEAAQLGTSGVVPATFSARGHWAQGYIAKLEELGITAFRDASLDIDQSVSRGLVVLTIIEAFGITQQQSESIFIDLPSNHVYGDVINTAASLGIIEGDKDQAGMPLFTVRPDDTINRAEITKVFVRFLQSCSLGNQKGVNVQGSLLKKQTGEPLSAEVLVINIFVALCVGWIAYRKLFRSNNKLHE
ncbi:DUF4215 domain-containing protein [Patescibacteria group bacterium]|nr:DUF4215 domain-containing protein [Patescibacteria group bacterium]